MCFDHSFEGKENIALKDVLEKELPGICLWGLKGLKRLKRNGFKLPYQSEDIVDGLADLNSPIGSFANDCLEVVLNVDKDGNKVDVSDSFVTVERVYSQYQDWCMDAGAKAMGKINFLNQLKSSLGKDFKKCRRRNGAEAVSVLNQIKFVKE